MKTKIEARRMGVYASNSTKENTESFIRFVSSDLCAVGSIWEDDSFGLPVKETYMTKKQMIKFLEESLEMIKSGI
jgi:hypothetical protein